MSAISQQDWQDQELGRAIFELDKAAEDARVIWTLIRMDEKSCSVRFYSAFRYLADIEGPTLTSAVREAVKYLR